MKSLWLALFFALLGLAPAQAQVNFTMPPPAGVVVGGVMVVTTCGSVNLANGTIAFLAMDHTGALCTNASGGGGGGGLSVVDQTAWVQGTSAFTPTGCVFNDTATLASGQEGTLRCTTDRQAKVLDSAVLAAVQAPVPAGTNDIGNIGVHSVVNVTPTNCSGTITSGGTAQNAFAAAATIHGFTIANIDSTAGSGEVLWISFTTTAAASTAASYPLSAPAATTFTGLSSFTSPLGFGMNTALSIVGATTGHKFSCVTW